MKMKYLVIALACSLAQISPAAEDAPSIESALEELEERIEEAGERADEYDNRARAEEAPSQSRHRCHECSMEDGDCLPC